jgi:carbon storage regulator CsrA
MLVLSRKFQEKIRIGNEITITILRAKGKAVRLGIEAPADIPVIRGELAFDVTCKAGEPKGALSDAWRVDDVSASTSTPHRQLSQQDTVTVPGSQVSLRRVGRGRAAEVLPQFLPGEGPLRAMLKERAITA